MEINKASLKVIGFDADDTLWVNETYFRDTEAKFAELMSKYETPNATDQALFKKEMQNLPIYGYGIKGFMLSMLESSIELSNGQVSAKDIQSIIVMGKKMILHPVEVLDGVREVLEALNPHYRLIILTKGDLLDQERKLEKSGLSSFFHHVEVLSDKRSDNYAHLLKHLQINPAHFLMVGNSLKSDVLPLLEIGAQAIHVPFHTTWQHEEVSTPSNVNYITLNNISLLTSLLVP